VNSVKLLKWVQNKYAIFLFSLCMLRETFLKDKNWTY